MVQDLLDAPPSIVLAKTTTRNGSSHFERYNTGQWGAKVAGLFGWDDEPAGASKRRGWLNSPFRRTTRRLHDLLLEELGHETTQQFADYIQSVGARKFRIIPQYDVDKLSVLKKASKHNAESTADDIKAMTELERTNWLMPQLEPQHFPLLQLYDRAVYEGRGQNLSEREPAAKEELFRALAKAPTPASLGEQSQLKREGASQGSLWNWSGHAPA